MRLSIAGRLTLGLVVALGSLGVMSGAVWWSVHQVDELRVEAAAEREYADVARACALDQLDWMRALQQALLANVTTIPVALDPSQGQLGQWLGSAEVAALRQHDPQLEQTFAQITVEHHKLHQLAGDVSHNWQARHELLMETVQAMRQTQQVWNQSLALAVLREEREPSLQLDPTRTSFGYFVASAQSRQWAAALPAYAQAMEKASAAHAALFAGGRDVVELLVAGRGREARAVYIEHLVPRTTKFNAALDEALGAEQNILQAQEQARVKLREQISPQLETVRALLTALHQRLQEREQEAGRQVEARLAALQRLDLVLLLLGGFTIALVTLSVSRGIVRSVRHLLATFTQLSEGNLTARCPELGRHELGAVGHGVNDLAQNLQETLQQVQEASSQVHAAAGEIAAGAQRLAEGASNQASSVEEITASLEELSAMSGRTAQSVGQARQTSATSTAAAEQGNAAMTQMVQAISRIKSTSDETATIIKTIDEIAFQTNLLALNAAVEAARAGDAGKGFAVVAQEVRNLAQRSAEAAKSTARLIQQGVRSAADGVQLNERVNQVLTEINQSTGQVSTIINEIAAVATEQSEGLTQITAAIGAIDQTIQGNAAHSEQSAAAAEEMNRQVEALNELVGRFQLR